jgi:hypothetical protein
MLITVKYGVYRLSRAALLHTPSDSAINSRHGATLLCDASVHFFPLKGANMMKYPTLALTLTLIAISFTGCSGGSQTVPPATTSGTTSNVATLLPPAPLPAPSPITSLADPRIVMAAAPAVATGVPVLQPIVAPSGPVSQPANTAASTKVAGMGLQWQDSGYDGYYFYLPVPVQSGYLYTTPGDYLQITSSLDADPISCLAFGIMVSGSLSDFYVQNFCQNGNQPYGYLLADIPVTQAFSDAYAYPDQAGSFMEVEEVKQSDGLHVYLSDAANGGVSYVDILGYGVTGTDPASKGLWPGAEYSVASTSCSSALLAPSPASFWPYLGEVYDGTTWTLPKNSPTQDATFGSPTCEVWGTPTKTDVAPYYDVTPFAVPGAAIGINIATIP